ncbi:MAG: ABC transporter ATP-binding protein, partial [Gaiellaceae bacterium]
MVDGPILEMRGITKRFPGVLANDGVDFELRRGEVHALLGENGAGKSTLMSVLYGLYHPDEGQIFLSGKEVSIDSPRAAIDLGIGMVHQHFMLIPVMTVAENIVLGVEPHHAGVFLDHAAARERVLDLSRSFGLAVDPDARIDKITVGQQQRVEIIKALYRKAEILILDEPTAVLTPQEATELFGILEKLRQDGLSIIFISHKLNEVLEIADRITVLRRGKLIETVQAAGATEAELARRMVGREVLLQVDKAPAAPGEALFEVENLHALDDRGLEAVRGVSFTVRAGEIVAIAGVDGNGQTQLIEAVTGLRGPTSGRVEIAGHDVTGASVHKILATGVGHIPEDRQKRGLVLEFNLAENFALHDFDRPPNSHFGWLRP